MFDRKYLFVFLFVVCTVAFSFSFSVMAFARTINSVEELKAMNVEFENYRNGDWITFANFAEDDVLVEGPEVIITGRVKTPQTRVGKDGIARKIAASREIADNEEILTEDILFIYAIDKSSLRNEDGWRTSSMRALQSIVVPGNYDYSFSRDDEYTWCDIYLPVSRFNLGTDDAQVSFKIDVDEDDDDESKKHAENVIRRRNWLETRDGSDLGWIQVGIANSEGDLGNQTELIDSVLSEFGGHIESLGNLDLTWFRYCPADDGDVPEDIIALTDDDEPELVEKFYTGQNYKIISRNLLEEELRNDCDCRFRLVPEDFQPLHNGGVWHDFEAISGDVHDVTDGYTYQGAKWFNCAPRMLLPVEVVEVRGHGLYVDGEFVGDHWTRDLNDLSVHELSTKDKMLGELTVLLDDGHRAEMRLATIEDIEVTVSDDTTGCNSGFSGLGLLALALASLMNRGYRVRS